MSDRPRVSANQQGVKTGLIAALAANLTSILMYFATQVTPVEIVGNVEFLVSTGLLFGVGFALGRFGYTDRDKGNGGIIGKVLALALIFGAGTMLLPQTAWAQAINPQPTWVEDECYNSSNGYMTGYDPATGALAPQTTTAPYGSGTGRLCVPWHDSDQGNESQLPQGELADCEVTFFDGSTLQLPPTEVGKILTFNLPKDGIAVVTARCTVRGLTSADNSRPAQYPPFLPPVAPVLLD